MSVAVVFDVSGIQKYVFGSNKLKENLGASYIITSLYEPLRYLLNKTDKECNGYIGGGNALIVIENIEKAKKIIKDFTLNALQDYPGLEISVGINENFDKNFEKDSVKKLFKDLQAAKNTFSPITTIPTHGITVECVNSGYSADYRYERYSENNKKEIDYISNVSYAKLIKVEDANKKIDVSFLSNNKYSDKLDDKFMFSDDLSKLGQTEGDDSHIAVVHIDGNGMSLRFAAIDSVCKMRNLSDSVNEAVENSFMQLIHELTEDINNGNFEESKSGFKLNKENGKTVLPLRPLIISGDDICFVSEGRLGIYFAYKFLDILSKKTLTDGENISACAGVSVVGTKYPFYRAYVMAEELCSEAKEARMKKKISVNPVPAADDSFIDFNISYGGISGSIKDIRKRHYKAPGGNLCMRPYSIGAVRELIGMVKKMGDLPKSDIKQLREILGSTEDERNDFINHMRYRGKIIPDGFMNKNYMDIDNGKSFFVNSETPYMDIIEMMNLLPLFVIERGEL